MNTRVELTGRQQMLVIIGLLAGVQMAPLSLGILGTAMPRIAASLGEMTLYSWTFTTYLLISTALMPVFGKLSDIYGRRRLFLLGLAIFIIGSGLCGLSQTMVQLIIFRSIQGLGAGIILPISLASVADIFPPAQRSRMLALMASLWGISSTIGPVVGGYVADTWGWRWVFYVNLPLGFLSMALCYLHLRDRRDPGLKRQVDYMGVFTLLAGLFPLLLALSLGGKDYAWDSPVILAYLAVAGVMLVLFPFVEARAAEPIIPLDLFRNSIFTVSVGASFLAGFALFGITTLFMPLFLQGVAGVSAADSGMLLAPMTLGMVATSVVAGHLIERIGYRKVALGAMGLMVAGTALLATMHAGTTREQAVAYVVVLGFGWGPFFPVFTIAAQNAVRHSLIGVVSSATQFFRSLGFSMGVTIMGAFLTTTLDAQIRQQPGDALPGGLEEVHSLLNPAALANVPTAVLSFFKESLAFSLQRVFLASFLVMVAAFLVTVFLKERPLGKTWETSGAEESKEPKRPSVAVRQPADPAGK